MTLNPAHLVLQHVRCLLNTPGAEHLGDAELLQRFARMHDEAAFAAVVRRHGPLVLGVCRRILQHPQDAEDAFQATFLTLARLAGARTWQASVGPWLYRVACRLARRARTRAERRPTPGLLD